MNFVKKVLKKAKQNLRKSTINLIQKVWIEFVTKDILEIGDYLTIETDKNDKISIIQSLKPFYWQEWSFKEDIEREDWSKSVDMGKDEYTEIIFITGNFTPDNGELEKEFLAKLPKIAKERYKSNLRNPFVKYDFEVNFGSTITIGSVLNSCDYFAYVK